MSLQTRPQLQSSLAANKWQTIHLTFVMPSPTTGGQYLSMVLLQIKYSVGMLQEYMTITR